MRESKNDIIDIVKNDGFQLTKIILRLNEHTLSNFIKDTLNNFIALFCLLKFEASFSIHMDYYVPL